MTVSRSHTMKGSGLLEVINALAANFQKNFRKELADVVQIILVYVTPIAREHFMESSAHILKSGKGCRWERSGNDEDEKKYLSQMGVYHWELPLLNTNENINKDIIPQLRRIFAANGKLAIMGIDNVEENSNYDSSDDEGLAPSSAEKEDSLTEFDCI